MQAVKDMIADLNELLDADARGEHTARARSTTSWTSTASSSRTTRRSRRADRLPRPPGGRAGADGSPRRPNSATELAALMAQSMEDMGLAARCPGCRRAAAGAARPATGAGRARRCHDGEQPLGMSDATTALAELADLEELSRARPGLPGASLDDIDEEAIGGRSAGRPSTTCGAAPDRARARAAGLSEPGRRQARALPQGGTPAGRDRAAPGVRPLRPVGRGDHDVADAGVGGRTHRRARAWQFGDEQPLDVVRTVRTRCCAPAGGRGPDGRAGDAIGRRLRGGRDRAPHLAPRSACSSTSRTRWPCAAPGAWPSRPRSRCTRW